MKFSRDRVTVNLSFTMKSLETCESNSLTIMSRVKTKVMQFPNSLEFNKSCFSYSLPNQSTGFNAFSFL